MWSNMNKTPTFLRFSFKQKSPPLGWIWIINPERVHLVWTGNCLSAAWACVGGRIPIRNIRTTLCWCHTTSPDFQNLFCSPVLHVTTTNHLQFLLSAETSEGNQTLTSLLSKKALPLFSPRDNIFMALKLIFIHIYCKTSTVYCCSLFHLLICENVR